MLHTVNIYTDYSHVLTSELLAACYHLPADIEVAQAFVQIQRVTQLLEARASYVVLTHIQFHKAVIFFQHVA